MPQGLHSEGPAGATLLIRWPVALITARLQRCVTTRDFIALAERTSGEQLDGLSWDWLYEPERPAGY